MQLYVHYTRKGCQLTSLLEFLQGFTLEEVLSDFELVFNWF